MANKKFNPEQWSGKPEGKAPKDRPDSYSDIETVVRRIEEQQVDITSTYERWLMVGFAISEAHGEAGRDLFHRVSRFYPGYTPEEADKQYDACLKSHGHGVNPATFFQLAKEHGIDIKTHPAAPVENAVSATSEAHFDAPEEAKTAQKLPTFPDAVYTRLPEFLQRVVSIGETPEERDTLLIGAIVTLSAVMPNIYGYYDRAKVYANLYLFLTARASSGKGRLSYCRLLVQFIDEELEGEYRQQVDLYQMKLREYENNKTDTSLVKPQEPPFLKVLFPANISATGMYQMLGDNHGRGLIFETEGDTLANSFVSDYGNFSDGFRKAFHHEPIAYHRRKNNEHVEINEPQLSAALVGTPQQVVSLIPDAENGLFSRFIIYVLESELKWKNVFPEDEKLTLNAHFAALGREYHLFYNYLKDISEPLRFRFTPDQCDRFNAFFEAQQARIYGIWGDEMIATVRRMGLICFRMAMVLSVLRMMETGDLVTPPVCMDEDFQTSLDLCEVLLTHAERVFHTLFGKMPVSDVASGDLKELFFRKLPAEFGCAEYIAVAKSIGLNERTAEGYIRKAAEVGKPIARVIKGRYRKTVNTEEL